VSSLGDYSNDSFSGVQERKKKRVKIFARDVDSDEPIGEVDTSDRGMRRKESSKRKLLN
jgi:hypothetical protein